MELPDRITIPRLSPEKIRALWAEFPSDLTSVGPSKPLGDYPLDTLQYFGVSPDQLVDALNRKPGVTAYITSESPTHGAGITAFHRETLQQVLDRDDNPAILQAAGWPTEATAFAKRINAEWADYQTQPALCGVIADAFSGQRDTIATLLKELERQQTTGERVINHQNVMKYVEQCAAGMAPHIGDLLNFGEAKLMASRMIMEDLITCVAEHQSFRRYRGSRMGGELSLTPGDETDGKDDLYPLLTLTLDFEPAWASALLAEADERIRIQGPIAGQGFATRVAHARKSLDRGSDSAPPGATWSARHASGKDKGQQEIGF
jgi:hypothetical protein